MTGLCMLIYRVAHKKRPELCITMTARILYVEKFPFAHLYIIIFCYLLINVSNIIHNVTKCQLMT